MLGKIEKEQLSPDFKTEIEGFGASLSDRAYNCEVTNTTNIVTSNNVTLKIPFNTNKRDVKGMHNISVNDSRINILKSGTYNIIGTIEWDANTSGTRTTTIKVNDTYYIGIDVRIVSAAEVIANQVVAQSYLSVGDYIELEVSQSTGGALSIFADTLSPKLSIQKVGD